MSNENDKEKTATHARAKNQTVMLTPEITGQVRAMLQQSDDKGSSWDKPEPAKPVVPKAVSAPAPVEQAPQAPAQHPPAPVQQPPAPVQYAAAPVPEPAVSASGDMYLVPVGKVGRLVGFLICYDKDEKGQMLEIRSGRWLVSNAPSAHGNTLVISDETVSSLHAIIRVSEAGVCQVMDQLAEFGTSVIRYENSEEEEIVGSTTTVDHGDIVRFGDLSFTVVLIPQSDTE